MTISPSKVTSRIPAGLVLFFSKFDFNILVLFVLPWLLLAINQTWIFTTIGYIDPWLYWGYFNNFGSFTHAFSGVYYGARLPWIIPGYICYKIFPALIANYVLHLGVYYIAVFSLYFIVKLTINKRTALIISILMGCFAFFQAAVGTDYIDGAGIAYIFLTLLFLTLAARSTKRTKWTFAIQHNGQNISSLTVLSLRSGILLFAAGALIAAFIYTNTFLVIWIPVLIIFYGIVNHNQSKNSLPVSIFVALLGFVFCTFLLCCVSQIAGGPFLFFIPSVTYAIDLFGQDNPWLIAGYNWLKIANWLVLPVLIFLSSLVSLLYQRFKPTGRQKSSISFSSIFSLCYITLFIIMVILQLMGNPVLQLNYYASYLIPAMFLAAGSQISLLFAKINRWQFTGLTGGLIILLVISFYAPFRSVFPANFTIIYPIVLAALVIIIIMALRVREKLVNWISIALLFVFLAGANLTFVSYYWWRNFEEGQQPKQLFLTVAKSDEIIKKQDPEVKMYFWYSSADPQFNAYLSISSTRLWGYRLINENFPSLQSYEIAPGILAPANVTIGTKIAILSDDAKALEKAETTLNELGMHAKLIGTERVEQGYYKVTMTFIEVVQK